MSNKRPLLMSLPAMIRGPIYMRHYAKRHARWPKLFERATLRFASDVAMVDLVPGDIISGHIAFTGEYESDLSARVRSLANEGGIFVDVGANMGYFTLLWAAARQDNHVIAFEASPRIYAKLARNVAANGLGSRVEALPKAATDKNGDVTFDIGPADQTGWGGIAANGANGVTVSGIRLDDVIGDRSVAVLKIDVEGADFLVLSGCERALSEGRIGTVFYESNSDRMAKLGLDISAAEEFLARVGYEAKPINPQHTEWMATPRRG